MKNNYIIVKHIDKDVAKLEGCTETLYYNGRHGPSYISDGRSAEIFTNKKHAMEKMRWANDYATGSELKGWTEIVELTPVSASVQVGTFQNCDPTLQAEYVMPAYVEYDICILPGSLSPNFVLNTEDKIKLRNRLCEMRKEGILPGLDAWKFANSTSKKRIVSLLYTFTTDKSVIESNNEKVMAEITALIRKRRKEDE